MKASIITLLALASIGIALFLWQRRASQQRERVSLFAELRSHPRPVMDFSTAEGAVLCLEDAFRRRDIEAAVAAKDFKTEARLMLKKTGFKDSIDNALIAQTAAMLETSFRDHTTKVWPDFEGLESFFTSVEPFEPGEPEVFVVTEVCRYPDGGLSRQEVLTTKTPAGWRVLNPLSD